MHKIRYILIACCVALLFTAFVNMEEEQEYKSADIVHEAWDSN